MYDDDQGTDEPGGKILHSGIRSEGSVGPADYAIPEGAAALQDDLGEDTWGFRSDDTAPPPVVPSRRRVLWAAAACVAAVTGSFLVGRSVGGADGATTRPRPGRPRRLTPEDLELIDAARRWADMRIETLAESAPAFLWVFQVVEPDEALRRGLDRLCEYAILQGGETGYRTAVRVLRAFEDVEAPAEFDRHRQGLQDVIWRWQMVKERERR